MTRDELKPSRGPAGRSSSNKRPTRSRHARPGLEPLEGRQLLSTTSTNFTTKEYVSYHHATYQVSISGPGSFALRPAGHGQNSLDLYGTTSASAISVAQTATYPRYDGSFLPIGRISVHSGQLGQIQGAGSIDLLGQLHVSGAIQTIQLGAIGPNAQIQASGGLGSLNVTGKIQLGPTGQIVVAGDLSGGLTAGTIDLNGGEIVIGHDLTSLTTGGLWLSNGGLIAVGDNLGTLQDSGMANLTTNSALNISQNSGAMTFDGAVSLESGSLIKVGRDMTGSFAVGGNMTLDNAQISIHRDLTGQLSVNGTFAVLDNAAVTIGRDLSSGLNVNGDLILGTGGSINVGRNVGAGLTVTGNLSTQAGGTIQVGGNLVGLNVGGFIVGQGSSVVDLSVGLDLSNWVVSGGAPGQGGVDGFNVDVGKNITGLNVLHGFFNDFITAGVSITGVTVGADGPVAVYDSEIRAGVSIKTLTLTGDVESDHATNPSGRNTRIIAGENRAGQFEIGGSIDNFVITGSLINAVVAASVTPNANGTYDPPAGGLYRPPANGGVPFAAPPFAVMNGGDKVLLGSVNHSFAPMTTTSTASTTTGGSTTTLSTTTGIGAYPSQATVDGAVVTTAHSSTSDYAGIFAKDIVGVYVGALPTNQVINTASAG